MTPASDELAARLERFVTHHVLHGETLALDELVADRPDLAAPLADAVARYLALARGLEQGPGLPDAPPDAGDDVETIGTAPLPVFEGFRTIERLGRGGMGEVYKLEDLALGRLVAAKVLRADRPGLATLAGFLREARALALFSDRRIVQIYEVRTDAVPPVIVMELVDGFEIGRVGRSLEPRQQARLLAEVCEALAHAHGLGLQHRDLKPSNIMVDAALQPRLLDFGLSAGDPTHGHLRGTLPYLAPEQLDPREPIDGRTDVYAVGVILYELLCGALPYAGASVDETIAAIRAGRPRLPVEIAPAVPEPLQAIALTAMERDPARRYPSAAALAADLRRFIAGQPVTARPSIYAATLAGLVRPHLAQIEDWERLHLLHRHEAEGLRAAYRQLEGREDDWILESRHLSHSQIALYLGAFLLLCGSLFYFAAHRVFEAIAGLARPIVALGLPFAGLNAGGLALYRRDHRAVAVAFLVGGVGLLPLFLLIAFHETGLFSAAADAPGQLLGGDVVSNRQLQVTATLACGWAAALALLTRTVGLSTIAAALGVLVAVTLMADAGLRDWLAEGRYDWLALHLAPLVPLYGMAGLASERRARPWLARPIFLTAATLLVVVLELAALDGRAFSWLGFSAARLHAGPVPHPARLDTLLAMTVNGVLIYLAAWAIERRGSALMRQGAGLLFAISPFAMLQPLGLLCKLGDYSPRYSWAYLVLALATAWLSHWRQRRSFYYAGLLNTGWALWVIAGQYEWFDDPLWAVLLIAAGLALLVGGLWLAHRERRRTGSGAAG